MKNLLIILFFVTLGTKAQEPCHYFFNEDDGLPSNTVYDIMQDSQGYMWMGTEKGLVRYDGQHFKTYKTEGQKGGSCTGLIEGGGRIWCVNFARQIFYVENDSLHTLKLWNGTDKQSVLDIAYNDKDSCLYVGCGLGIYCLNERRRTVELITNPADSTAFVWETLIKDGILYGLSPSKCIVGNMDGLKYFPLNTDGTPKYIQTLQSYQDGVLIAFNDEGFWYEFTKEGLLKTDLQINTPNHELINHNLLVMDKKGQVWFSKKDELFIGSDLFPSNVNVPKFKGVSVSDVIRDKEGQYWLSTLDRGVMVIPDINIWKHTEMGELKDIVKTPQGLWGLSNEALVPINHTAKSVQLPSDIIDVNRAWFNEQDNSWLVSAKGFFHLKAGKVERLLSMSSVKDVEIIGDSIYYATNIGVWVSGLNDIRDGMMKQLSLGRCYALAARHGYLLAGFDNGLQLVDLLKNGGIEVSTLDTILYISDMVNADDTYVYIATQGDGLKAYNKGALLKEWFRLPPNTNNVNRLATQGDKLVAAFDEGVLVIDLKEETTAIIDRVDGLPTHDIWDVEIDGNRVYLATAKGLISFPIDMKGVNELAPDISIKLEGKKGSAFKYNDSDFFFQLFSGSYKHNGLLKFKYRLQGFEGDWIESDFDVPVVGYRKLPPGKYTFEVVAVNEDGLESETPATYTFTIETPFWKTIWFNVIIFAAMIGLTLAITLLIVASRRRVMERRNQAKLEQSRMKEEMTAYQLKALRAQMNPHFIFNALNTLQRYIMTNNKSEAGEYLGRFSDLMRKFLSMSESQYAKLDDEIEMLRLYLDIEKERMKDDFTYSIQIADDIDTAHIQIPSMLVQPIAENAIKHGLLHKKGEKHLKLDFKLINDKLQITIEDNGVGRERSKEINSKRDGHQSFGLKAVQRRIDLINQTGTQKAELKIEDLFGEDGKGVGTRVILILAL